MRKFILVLLVLLLLLLASCSKDDCNCIKETYSVIEKGDRYSFELDKSEQIDCVDEIIAWADEDHLIIINCY
jgi:hypothetical protein